MVDDLFVVRLDPDVKLPARKSDGAAGYDLYATKKGRLKKGEIFRVDTGLALAIPKGHFGQIVGRSGLEIQGLKVLGVDLVYQGKWVLAGTIDEDYRGQVGIVYKNLTQQELGWEKGDRIAQLVIIPYATPAVTEVSELPGTDRGVGGFGSTGQ